MLFTVHSPTLRAVALLAAEKDTRGYLNGVHFRVVAGHLTLAATNGNGLLLFRQPAPGIGVGSYGIVPADFIKGLPEKGDVTFAFGEKEVSVHVPGGATYGAKLIDGEFPDLARVMPPESEAGKPAEFDFDLLARFQKAGKLAGWGAARVQPHGTAAAAVLGFAKAPEAFGVLMPCLFWLDPARTETLPLPTVPDWARL